MRIHYLHKWMALLPMLLLFVTTSCTQEDEIQADMGNYDNQVLIRISTGDERTTRAASGIEGVVNTLHLFVFEATGGILSAETKCHYSLSLQHVDITKPVSLGSKKNFDSEKEYKICLIANYDLPTEVESKIENGGQLAVSDLNSLIETEMNKPPFTNLEALLMEGESDAVELNDETSEPIEVPATLTRAAAKIVLNIALSSEFLGSYTPFVGLAGNNQITFTNPALTTNVRSGQGIYRGSASGTFTYDYEMEEGGIITYTLYSYACEWVGGDLETASSLVINIPVQPKKPESSPLEINSYAISLDKFTYQTVNPAPEGMGDSRDYSLQRNYEYTIEATVRALGSNEPSEPVPLEGVGFEAMEWGTINIDIDGETSGDFLSVNYHELSLTDDTKNSVLHFDASDDVTVALAGDVYYYNKFGQRKVVGEGGSWNDPTYGYDVKFEYAEGEVTGNVTILSEPLPNNAPKYFRIKITNNHNKNLVEYVDVVQYPLNYVTSTFGYYSSLRDEDGRGCDFLDGPTNDSDTRYTKENNNNELDTGEGVNGYFVVKYVRWNEVDMEQDDNGKKVPTLLKSNHTLDYYYYDDDDGNGNSNSNRSQWNSASVNTHKNPRMYHVRITASSDEYTLGVPPLDENGYTQGGEDVGNMVSPSFMIASQLGAFQGFPNYQEAQVHCSRYEETTFLDYQEGIVVKYKNWRVPTPAELTIIGKTQTNSKNNYSAIDEVLALDQYWCSLGKVWNTKDQTVSNHSSGGWGRQPAVRCVRDANEPGKIIRIKDTTTDWPDQRPSVTPY